jgi:hypothetical protein
MISRYQLIGIGLFLFSSCGLNEAKRCDLTYQERNLRRSVVYGTIDSIYTPELNHGYLRIKIRNSFGHTIYLEQSYMLDQSFYSDIQKGDSIIKRLGFLDVILVKPNGGKKLYRFNCAGIEHDTIR